MVGTNVVDALRRPGEPRAGGEALGIEDLADPIIWFLLCQGPDPRQNRVCGPRMVAAARSVHPQLAPRTTPPPNPDRGAPRRSLLHG
jgi:hypothetical protein